MQINPDPRPLWLYALCCLARQNENFKSVLQEDKWLKVKPLPPVHLLHQVSTYQEACPVEAMRAMNTFERDKEAAQ